MLAAVAREQPHLAFATLAAWVDRSLPPTALAAAEAHVAACPRCARELADLAAAAPQLAAALATPPSPALPRPSFAARLGAWFGQPGAWGAVTAALVVAVAVGVMLHNGGLVTGRGADTDARVRATLDAAGYDRSALAAAGKALPAARAALAREDWAALATALEAPAAAGDATAQSALGLLHAEGLGVKADAQAAAAWWSRAASSDAAARYNLQRLNDARR
ncbi:MAG: zf-HC2 domain-containing protein [Proteobacteria bacterium]|nr:zf-HC2 domain-containing protein [Pseudomonadota bacterium]